MLERSRSSIRRSILSTFKKIKEEFRIVGKRRSGMFDVGDGFGVSRRRTPPSTSSSSSSLPWRRIDHQRRSSMTTTAAKVTSPTWEGREGTISVGPRFPLKVNILSNKKSSYHVPTYSICSTLRSQRHEKYTTL